MLFDTHAHLNNEQLASDLTEVLHRAEEAGVVAITAIGTDVQTSRRCVQLAAAYDHVYAAVGIHPTVCQNFDQKNDWDSIVELSAQNHVVAIGETGLDLHWDASTLEIQKQWFQKHITLSFETSKPLVIHMRNCESEIVDFLERSAVDGRIHGIMHSFTGSIESAARCLKLGMSISFAGMLTFKKSTDLREVAATIPDDRLLIETDAPYLSPHPIRGKRPNQPSHIVHTAACLADVKNISVEALSEMTTANARRIFQIR
jgi:TatD DNase family protein